LANHSRKSGKMRRIVAEDKSRIPELAIEKVFAQGTCKVHQWMIRAS